jgi:hypothetical protein
VGGNQKIQFKQMMIYSDKKAKIYLNYNISQKMNRFPICYEILTDLKGISKKSNNKKNQIIIIHHQTPQYQEIIQKNERKRQIIKIPRRQNR